MAPGSEPNVCYPREPLSYGSHNPEIDHPEREIRGRDDSYVVFFEDDAHKIGVTPVKKKGQATYCNG